MGQVIQFSRRNRGFDPDATAVLIAAYESAIAAIARSGSAAESARNRRAPHHCDGAEGRTRPGPIVRGRARHSDKIHPVSARTADNHRPAPDPGRYQREFAGVSETVPITRAA